MANQYTLKNGGYEPFIGNFGLVPQPPIPEPDAEDNGKVLGVSNGSYALVNGGGGGNTMVCNLIASDGGMSVENTAQEILDAYLNGAVVMFKYVSESASRIFTIISASLTPGLYSFTALAIGSGGSIATFEFTSYDPTDPPVYSFSN